MKMNTALAGVAGPTNSSRHNPDLMRLAVGANVLSLQARRTLRQPTEAGNGEGLHVESHPDTTRLKLLLELASESVANQDFRGLIRAVMMRIGSAVDSDRICLHLRRQNCDFDLYSFDFSSEGSRFGEETVSNFAGTIAKHVLTAHKLWAGTREQVSADFPSEPILKKQFSTACVLPLSGRSRVIGVLSLMRTRHNPYSEDDLDFVTGVCSQIAIALENALACREISELKEKLAQEKLYLEEEIRSQMNFDQIVGESPAIMQVLELIQTVAPSDSTVLLLGETGTGKELLARAIHDHSRRKSRTFVKLNCAAIPTGLFESELFGHEKGRLRAPSARSLGG